MNNNNYIIPANSKKSKLYFGYFTMTDLIIVGSGAMTTLILLMSIPNPTLNMMLIMLLPLLVTSFLVMPVAHYHNVLQFIINIIGFYFGRRKYYWRGWCIKHGEEN